MSRVLFTSFDTSELKRKDTQANSRKPDKPPVRTACTRRKHAFPNFIKLTCHFNDNPGLKTLKMFQTSCARSRCDKSFSDFHVQQKKEEKFHRLIKLQ